MVDIDDFSTTHSLDLPHFSALWPRYPLSLFFWALESARALWCAPHSGESLGLRLRSSEQERCPNCQYALGRWAIEFVLTSWVLAERIRIAHNVDASTIIASHLLFSHLLILSLVHCFCGADPDFGPLELTHETLFFYQHRFEERNKRNDASRSIVGSKPCAIHVALRLLR